MSTTPHRRVARQVDRLFRGQLSTPAHQRLRQHLRGCTPCRGYYDAVREVEEALTPNAYLSPSANARLATLVTSPAATKTNRRPWFSFGLVAAAATAALLLALWPSGGDEFAPRGVAHEGSAAGLRLFRVDPTAPSIAPIARQPGSVAVAQGDIIQLAYHNAATGHGFSHAVVVGVDGSFALQWYHPDGRPEMTGGVALHPDVRDEPFGTAWSMRAPPGAVRLFAIFASGPIRPDDVETAVAAAKASGRTIAEVERLSGVGSFQDSVLLDVRNPTP